MQLNNTQRKIIIAMIIIMVGMLLFPPFHVVIRGTEINLGYAWLLHPPKNNPPASINAILLLAQWLGVVAIGGLLVSITKTSPVEHSAEHFQESRVLLDKNGPTGIGGWLMFFVVLWTIGSLITPIAMLSGFASEEQILPQLKNSEIWGLYKTVAFSITLISAAYMLFTSYRLWKSRSSSIPNKTIISIWTNTFGVTIVLLYFLPSSIFGDAAQKELSNEIFSATTKSIITSFVWTWYFIKSRRVHNTYNKNDGGSVKYDLISILICISVFSVLHYNNFFWSQKALPANDQYKKQLGYVPEMHDRVAKPDLDKAPNWRDITAKPEFWSLPPEERQKVKEEYFDYWIAPHAGDEAAALRIKFMAQPITKDVQPGK